MRPYQGPFPPGRPPTQVNLTPIDDDDDDDDDDAPGRPPTQVNLTPIAQKKILMTS